MDPKLEESRALAEMSALVHTIGASEPISPALLIEKFKDSPHEHLLFEAQAHCLDLKETEDESRAYVIHTLGALEVARKREELKTYEERLGRGELTNEEHRRYASMISEVRTLEQRLQTDARQQAAK